MQDFETETRFPIRKHPRMKHYDYATPNYYFVTICTKDRLCLFGNPEQLNAIGQIARDALEETRLHFPGVTVDKYVVMPNHIHAILVLHKHDTPLSTVIGQYKSAVTKQARSLYPDIQIWQTSFHDHVIRSQASYEKIWLYMEHNPIKWQEDCFYSTASAPY